MCCATLINDWATTRSIPNNMLQSLTQFGPYTAQFGNLACQLSACLAAPPSERAWWRGIVAVAVMSASPLATRDTPYRWLLTLPTTWSRSGIATNSTVDPA